MTPRTIIWIARAAAIAGAVSLAGMSLAGRTPSAAGALAAGWLLFAGIAAGGVALSTVLRLAHARWAATAVPAAESGAGFFLPAFVILGILLLGAGPWTPSAAGDGALAFAARAVRDLVSVAALWYAAVRYRRSAAATGAEGGAGIAAVVYLLIYVAAMTVFAIDFVIDPGIGAPSTVVPPFYFAGAFLGGLAWTALLVCLRATGPAAEAVRQDLGKLLFAFCILWGYLLWAAYLPVWYENMPDETGALLARWEGGWRYLTAATIGAVLVFPFFFLLPASTKKGRWSLAVAASSVLAGLLGDRLLLVIPSLGLSWGIAETVGGTAIVAGVGAVFVLSSRTVTAPN